MQANFGFLVYNQAEDLDVAGPWEIIKIWSQQFDGPNNVFTVSEKDKVITFSRDLKIISDYQFANCPKLDFLLVPGGAGRKTEVNNPKLIEFIQQQSKNSKYVLSVCTGSFLLQKAGLLQNHKATTYWLALPEIKQFPDIEIEEERFVRDGKIFTGAGVSSGIDLALAFIAEVAGEETAGKVQLAAEYFPPQELYCRLEDIPNLPKYLRQLSDS